MTDTVKPKPTSLRDIAERTGVSVMTVQRAIGAPHLVAEKTRRRILRVMQEVGYVPDRNAASLVSRSSGLVGLVVPSATAPTFAAEVEGVAHFGRTTGRDLLLADVFGSGGGPGDGGNSGEQQVLRAVLGRRPDGIVLTFSPTDAGARELLAQSTVPIVETWDDPAEPIDMVAGISNDAAARQVARYFANIGRRRAAFFGPPAGHARTRWTAFADEWARVTDGEAIHVPLETSGPWAQERFGSGPAFFDRLDGSPDGTADCVFCSTDVTAAAVVFEAQRRGLGVPDDLAVCGFGDLDIAASMTPALTTVSVPARDMGLQACELIAARRAKRSGPRRLLLATHLIVRDSA